MTKVYAKSKTTGHVMSFDSASQIYADFERMTAKAGKAAVREQAREELLELIKPGDRLYTTVSHVSRSGMSRNIRVYVTAGESIRGISRYVSLVLDLKQANDGGVTVGGCGMDMGYHLVYSVGRALFQGNFKCIGKDCPSNDHSNSPREDFTGKQHSDAGYSLRHSWL